MAEYIISSGEISSGILLRYDSMTVLAGGTATTTTVIDWGRLDVSSGGTATDIVWTPCEGRVYVSDGGYATFVSEYIGVYYGSANKLLSNAVNMDGLTISSSCEMNVMPGGIANSTTVKSSGYLHVSGNGTANSTTVNRGGNMYVSSGGTANEIVENGGYVFVDDDAVVSFVANTFSELTLYYASATVHSGTTANSITVNYYEAKLYVSSGGVVNSTIVISGGSLYVSSGGTANTTVVAGGNFHVSSGGEANDTVAGGYDAKVNVFSGGVVNNTTISDHGNMNIFSGGIANNTTVNSRGNLGVSSGGTANATTVNSVGSFIVFNGGVANSVSVDPGGNFTISSGGTATVVFNPWQGSITSGLWANVKYLERDANVYYGGRTGLVSRSDTIDSLFIENGHSAIVYSDGLANNITIDTYGQMHVSSGGIANNASIFGREGNIYVSSGGIVNNASVCGLGGVIYVSSGGTANNTFLNSGVGGGGLEVFSDGMANGVSVDNCYFDVSSGGTANNVTVNEGGRLTVFSGGTATNIKENGGAVELEDNTHVVFAPNEFSGLTISDASATVHSGTTANKITVKKGGELIVYSGGSAVDIVWTPCVGQVTLFGDAHVSFASQYSGVYYGSESQLISQAQIMNEIVLDEANRSMYVMADGAANNTTISNGGNLYVYSGGTANGALVVEHGSMFVSNGVANDTIVSGGRGSDWYFGYYDKRGILAVSQGGIAERTIVNNYGTLDVQNDGIANSTTVNAGGQLYVSAKGLASSTTVNSGGNMTVFSGGIVTNATVSSGGKIAISQGGSVNSTTLCAGGKLDIFSDGIANDTVVASGGSLHVSNGGTAKKATVDSNGSVFVSANGTADSTTVNSWGRIFVYSGGVADNTTVNLYGSLSISSGGTANQTIVESGQLFVSNGGYASGVILRAGTDRNQGDLFISSGGTAESVQIEQYGDCYVSGYGMVNGATANTTGYLRVENLGTATDIKENGGYVDVQNGAEVTFAANTFSSVELVNASATVHSDTIADNTKIGSNAYLYVYEGGSATETAVDSGSLILFNGGVAVKTNVNSGGQFYVSGGTATEVTAGSGAYLEFSITSDSLITGTSGGSAFEIKDGTVNDGYTLDSARIDLGIGVTATGMKVNQGGRLYVSAGATANEIVENGGSIDFEAEANISFAKNTFSGLVYSNASATIHSGTTAASIVVSSGGKIRIYSDGFADGVSVYDGGFLYISSGGTVAAIKENGGFVSVAEGAIVSFESTELKKLTLFDSASIHSNTRMTSTTVSRGGLYISNGGVADTTMLLDGRSFIFSGGVANSTTIYSRASIEVSSGGTASGVDIKFKGFANVSAGLLCDLNISSGGTLSLRSGKLSGKVEIESGAYVSALNDTILDFDISNVAPDTDALVNNLSLIRGSLLYTLTVGTQKSGSYMLAEGALRFNSTITVFSTEGIQLGTLTVGNSLTTEKAMYSLVSFGESLSVDVETFVPKAPTASADTTSATTQAVTVTAVFGDDCTIREYSYDGEKWLTYTEPIVFTENGTVYFRGADAAGNMSEVTSYTVDNIISAPLEVPVASADVTAATKGTVTVTASFSESATIRQYCLDGKTWLDYTDPLTFKENGTVIFLCQDATGAFTCTSYTVNNIDTTVPTDPSGLQAVVSDQTVVLVWNASTDNFGIQDYIVTYSLDGQEFTVRTSNTSYVLNNADFGDYSWSVQAVDFAGNESAATTGETFTVSGFKPYTVEYSPDNFEHVITFAVTTSSLDVFRMPGGIYQMRVKQEGSSEWMTGDPILAEDTGDVSQLIKSDADGNADVFFANAVGTWESCYLAQHVGSINDWSGTNEYAALYGKNKLADIIEGSTDANILLMTDDDNGDGLFIDDIYSALPGSVNEQQSRIAQIDEIRAGAGADIVDMTSQQFEYIGDGLTIHGGAGNDVIWANKGDNFLFGDAGNDRIVGASGDDVIAGGIGNDRMHGGGGNDIFAFGENWGSDTVEQLATGFVTLWFVSGDLTNWDVSTLTYMDGANSVTVKGITAEQVTLKFGDDSSVLFATLTDMGAFFDATTERIFEESGKGMLANL